MKTSRPLRLAVLVIIAMSLSACHFHRFGCGGPRWGAHRHYSHAPVIRFCR